MSSLILMDAAAGGWAPARPPGAGPGGALGRPGRPVPAGAPLVQTRCGPRKADAILRQSYRVRWRAADRQALVSCGQCVPRCA
jgi:hypothetical protein